MRPRLLDLLARTAPSGSCRIWQGWKNSDGYGYARDAGRDRPVHRVVYELAVGPIPPGLEIDHLCRVRDCVQPTHLEAVTHAENLARAGRSQTSCRKAGHDWTDSRNVYVRRNGHRWCAACYRQSRTEARRASAS